MGEREVNFGTACHPERSVTESKDLGGSFKLQTSSDRRGPSTALRPPFHLRFAQDDTLSEFRLVV